MKCFHSLCVGSGYSQKYKSVTCALKSHCHNVQFDIQINTNVIEVKESSISLVRLISQTRSLPARQLSRPRRSTRRRSTSSSASSTRRPGWTRSPTGLASVASARYDVCSSLGGTTQIQFYFNLEFRGANLEFGVGLCDISNAKVNILIYSAVYLQVFRHLKNLRAFFSNDVF